MTDTLYYWVNGLENYASDNNREYDQVIEIKRLNFFIGKNNAGKSRFLRSLFCNTLFPQDYHPILKNISTNDFFTKAINLNRHRNLHYSGAVRNINRSQISEKINESISQLNQFEFQIYANLGKIKRIVEFLENICFENSNILTPVFSESDFKPFKSPITEYEANKGQSTTFKKSFYVPTLRGMRPFTDDINQQPYFERTYKDYFKSIKGDNPSLNSENIITGERLYHELKIHLLGEPEQREIIRDYEVKLGQYFFDNQTVSLIPKHDQDVVNIKIGNDQQFPISQLGDGLQQAIILTYEAFIKKNEIHAFCIEEPESHMHAGMVRQLMNFYLNETKHYYFFTTHSNHLLDMSDESDQVIIQKFVKQPQESADKKFEFKIYRCDRDRDLLASLGVKPSSVYLANCTIWVEGITDRLYITKYMEKYLMDLETIDVQLYKKYRSFMPNYHYSFVEYAGSNLVHWSFSDNYVDSLEDKGLSAKAIASEMLLIADGDIKSKTDRVKQLTSELSKDNFFILKCKETENTLPKDSIIRVAQTRFSRMKSSTTKSYDISLINDICSESYFDHDEYGIGKLLDQQIKKPKSTATSTTAFADGQGVGTIKSKLEFCREIIKDFDDNPSWKLTEKAKEICERIFKHIEKCNR